MRAKNRIRGLPHPKRRLPGKGVPPGLKPLFKLMPLK